MKIPWRLPLRLRHPACRYVFHLYSEQRAPRPWRRRHLTFAHALHPTEESRVDLNPTLAEALPAAPPIPGLTFRHFRGAADYPALLAVNNGSKIADGLDYDLH